MKEHIFRFIAEYTEQLRMPTKLSKVTATFVLICAPFIGGLVGYTYGLQDAYEDYFHNEISSIFVSRIQQNPSTQNVGSSVASTDTTKTLEHLVLKNPDGSYKQTWEVIRQFSFTYQGLQGKILQVCDPMYVVNKGVDLNVCLGKGAILMDFNNDYTEIGVYNTLTLRDVERVHQIGFTEGSLHIATTSTKTITSLLVEKNNEHCITNDGMCGDQLYIGYRIEFPSLRVTEISKGNQDEMFTLWSLRTASWNQSGDKAVARVSCPEGCPEAVLIGYDVRTGASKTLLKEIDLKGQDRFKIEPSWVDDDTINVLGTELDL